MSTYTGDATLVGISNPSGSVGNALTTIYTVPTGKFARVTNITFNPQEFSAEDVRLALGSDFIINVASGSNPPGIKNGIYFSPYTSALGIFSLNEIILTAGQTIQISRASANMTVREFNTP